MLSSSRPPAARLRELRLDGFPVFVYGRTVLSRSCLWALALGIVVPLGCGPIQYRSRVSSHAASTLAQAKEAGAEQKAPYEYAKAAAYLRQAREDAGHAYFQTALDWGRRSEDCSQKAIERAEQPQPEGATTHPEQPQPEGATAHPENTTCGGP